MMSPMIGKVGPIRTAKTPKRVRFAGEDREQTRLIRQQEAQKRDARSLPRVDVDVTTSYELPAVSAAAEALFSYAKSTLGTVVEYGKTALSSSFSKVIPNFATDKGQPPSSQQQQASMLEYPPFLAGATPNVVKKNRRDYYQSIGVMNSMQKAKSYAPGSTPARTPEHLQSDKEKNWYRFHETPYAGHKLDFRRGRTLLPPPRPEYRFESPTRTPSKRKSSKSSRSGKSSAKKQKSALKKRAKPKLGELAPRRSNAEEFHANFSGKERNDLYAGYTRFLLAIKFDVKQYASLLQNLCLPTEFILAIHDGMKRSDWDYFAKILADEEYWAQVKGIGSTKVPALPNYVEPQSKRPHTNPCEYCKVYEWAGKVEVREVENDGDEVPVKGQTKFDVPYSKEEQAHIDAGRFYKVFHRFCHESRYDWKFPDPSKPCSWEGPNHPSAKKGKWSISKYDPRLRHFPLLMQRMPKRMRQIQQELSDTVVQLTAQDKAAWYFIQGIRRYNTRMAAMLERMDLERKRKQVIWPCQLQVQVDIKNKPEPEPLVIVEEEHTSLSHKRANSEGADVDNQQPSHKRAKFHIYKPGAIKETTPNGDLKQVSIEDITDGSHKQTGGGNFQKISQKRFMAEDIHGEDAHTDKRTQPQKLAATRTSAGSFGLFSDDEETDDDMKNETRAATHDLERPTEVQKEQPKLTWLQKLKAKEAELAAAEAEKAKADAKKEATKQHTPNQAEAAPSTFANKPFLPPVPTAAPVAAPKKPFVFEDPSPTQEQTIPGDDGRNPLKEHTNGVKPTSPVNLFGSAVATLAPNSGLFGQNSEISPLKPLGASTTIASGSDKTETVGLFGNEENIPTADTASVAPAPSIFAPKAPSTSAPLLNFGGTAAGTGLFSAPSASKEAENKPSFLFGKKAEPKDTTIASNEPKAAPPSLFSGLTAAPVTTQTTPTFSFGPKAVENASAPTSQPAPTFGFGAKTAPPVPPAPQFGFGPKPAETAPAPKPASTFSFGKPAETVPAIQATAPFSFGPTAAETTATTALKFSFGSKPAGTAPTALFNNTPTANLFGGVSTVPATTSTATTSAEGFGLFGTTSSAAPSTGTSATSGLFGSSPTSAATVPEATKPPASNFFSFGAQPQKTEAPSSNFFGAKPTTTPFSFGTTTKPAEPVAPTNPFTSGAASAPSNATSTPSVFSFSSATTTSGASAMTTSFPTTSAPFSFGTTAPAGLSASFPPATPQAQPPAFLFGGFKSSTTPTKMQQSSQSSRFSEDISMASPDQSPEKSAPPINNFGTNNMSNDNPFTSNKPFNFAALASMPNKCEEAPPALNFGGPTTKPAVGQPVPSVPSTTTTLPGAAPKFSFGSFTSMPGAPSATVAPSVAAPASTTFQFDAGGVDFNLTPNSPAGRRIATPKTKRFQKR